MKKLLLCVLAVFALVSCQQKIDVKDVPVFAWEGYSGSAQLREHFAKYKEYGLKGVCINVGFNVENADTAAKLAKEYGLEFHAWCPIMIQSTKQEGVDSTMYTVNRLGESSWDNPPYVPYYTTLDPRNPKVADFLIEKIQKIAAIPEVEYVQLDYIRYADVILSRGLWEKYGLVMDKEYPKADFCYCDRCVSEFKAETGIDIRATEQPDTVKAWAKWRCDNVTALVNKICDAVHQMGKKVSADVFPGPDSHAVWMVRQQWNDWNIDAVFPMNYNDFYLESPAWVGEMAAEEVKSVADKGTPVYSGLFICHDWRNKDKVTDPEGSGLVPSEIGEAAITSLKGGAAGVCLFAGGGMTEEHWMELTKAIKEYVATEKK